MQVDNKEAPLVFIYQNGEDPTVFDRGRGFKEQVFRSNIETIQALGKAKGVLFPDMNATPLSAEATCFPLLEEGPDELVRRVFNHRDAHDVRITLPRLLRQGGIKNFSFPYISGDTVVRSFDALRQGPGGRDLVVVTEDHVFDPIAVKLQDGKPKKTGVLVVDAHLDIGGGVNRSLDTPVTKHRVLSVMLDQGVETIGVLGLSDEVMAMIRGDYDQANRNVSTDLSAIYNRQRRDFQSAIGTGRVLIPQLEGISDPLGSVNWIVDQMVRRGVTQAYPSIDVDGINLLPEGITATQFNPIAPLLIAGMVDLYQASGMERATGLSRDHFLMIPHSITAIRAALEGNAISDDQRTLFMEQIRNNYPIIVLEASGRIPQVLRSPISSVNLGSMKMIYIPAGGFKKQMMLKVVETFKAQALQHGIDPFLRFGKGKLKGIVSEPWGLDAGERTARLVSDLVHVLAR